MAENNLNLEVVSPKGQLFSGSCNMAVVPSVSGDVGVMFGHESFISILKEGVVKIYDKSNKIIKEFDIKGGFAETCPGDKLLVLVD